jgi:hypothetical protein
MKNTNRVLRVIGVFLAYFLTIPASAQTTNIDDKELQFVNYIQAWSKPLSIQLNQLQVIDGANVPVLKNNEFSSTSQTKNIKAVSATFFQPAAVILGVPEYPVKEKVDDKISSNYLHQAMIVKLVVLDKNANVPTIQNLSYPLKPTQKFKIRLTSMFNAWVTLDQVMPTPNGVWYLKKIGQVYPAVGSAVLLKEGHVIDLPTAAGDYFQMEPDIKEKILLNVRHEQSKKNSVNHQPIYRRDFVDLSAYVQLVPPGKFPIFEQLISQSN